MNTFRPILATVAASLTACVQVAETASPDRLRANQPMPSIQGPPGHRAYDTPPRLLSGKTPVYPVSRELKGVAGAATIEYTISEDGTTRDLTVISADHPFFGDHAVIAVREWRYQPALRAGSPVSVRVRQMFKFSLPG